MKGIQKVRVSNKNTDFKLELRRNITLIRGNSGTGKTTLFQMISEYARLGESSGIRYSCEKKCVALTDSDWENQLRKADDCIVFVDEGDRFVNSKEFARLLRESTNYYVLFIRENLHELPYSVNEIYEIKTSGKYHTLRNVYTAKKGFRYSIDGKDSKNNRFDIVLTEDTKAGFSFFENYLNKESVVCKTAGNNSNIYQWILKHKEQHIFVVADGAAFGAEMNRIMELQKRFPEQITICLPESFEWLILNSGLIDAEDLQTMLDNPSEYIDSEKYFSWERFFTQYLIATTNNTHMKYSKDKLNAFYTIEKNAKQIAALILL